MRLRTLEAVAICSFLVASVVSANAQYAAGNFHYFLVAGNEQVEHVSIKGESSSEGTWAPINATLSTPYTSQLAGFSDYLGDHVYYVAANQHVDSVYYCILYCSAGTQNVWSNGGDLTTLTGAPLVNAGTALTGFDDKLGEHVFGFGTNQHVFHFLGSGSWKYQDLTSATGGPLAASGSALTSFSDSLGEHIFYLAANQHVYQLYYGYNVGSWQNTDLNGITGAPSALGGSALVSFGDGGQDRVFYQGSNLHLEELLTVPGKWTSVDITTLTGGALPNSKSPLTGFASSGDEYVLYQTNASGTNLIDEAFYNGSVWSSYAVCPQQIPQPVVSGTAFMASAGASGTHNDVFFLYPVSGQGHPAPSRVILSPYGGCSVDTNFPYIGVPGSALLEFIDP